VLVNTFSLLGTLVASNIIERSGRKPLLVGGWSLVSAILLLIFITLYMKLSSFFTLVLICFYMFAFGIGPGPLVYLYIPDILPDIGVGTLMGTMWIFDVVVSIGFPIAVE